ncbi:T6SS immunity protein Tli4 family protein [Lysobacter capsici]|uniref:T6SS immunity protein Tli4 family protein n=1 Tax=Lysobacter capsici TaxID=435897 RepID=UPI001C002245|nr:T6SS immunity protein Tli4 family protein [Lysobacter capsici]QWF19565.1 hypothetical protein KME82_12875 [Lysobacter capsici]
MSVTHNVRTHCAGRFLINLPETFKQRHLPVADASDVTFYFGKDENFKTVDVAVISDKASSATFAGMVRQRATALSVKTNYESNSSMLVAEQPWSQGQILLRYYASPDITDSHVHELHVLIGTAHLILRTKSFGDTFEQAEERLKTLVAQVRTVSEPSRAGPGFCLGPVVIAAESDFEESEINFDGSDEGGGPIRFEIATSTFLQPADEPSLIARGEANLKGLGAEPTTLKKGKVQLAGGAGEQWLGRFDEDGSRQHGFYAETDGKAVSKLHPKVSVKLFTGGQSGNAEKLGSKLDDEAAIQLWDSIIVSMKPRPGAG